MGLKLNMFFSNLRSSVLEGKASPSGVLSAGFSPRRRLAYLKLTNINTL